MDLEEGIQAFVEHMLHNVTLNLVELELGTFKLTGEICSGFMVERDGRLFVLTAGHGLRHGHWFIETSVKFESDTQVLTIPFQPANFISQVNLGKPFSVQDIDLAWIELDRDRLRAEMRADPKLHGRSLSFPAYKGPLDQKPSTTVGYGFAAWNRARYRNRTSTLKRKPSYEVGMQYVGDMTKAGVRLHRFQPARDYMGPRYYRGASGAPIADPTGLIVAMVLTGDNQTGEILGLPLASYSSVLSLGSAGPQARPASP